MSSTSTQKKKKKNKFGATSPPFIDYLKEILRRYPDGGQILKELIQNADDAGASSVVFVHDETHYGTQSLWTEELAKHQGPALYAFNDAAFTEEDWEGIQRVGRSIKQDDPTKVGRFGIGFNSVYHITDLPCVFSSKHLAIFDPQKKMFADEEEGYRWSLDDEDDRDSLLKLKDQFQPFQNVVNQINSCSWEKVISEDQYFRGTLFRFPLRNEASEISDNLYDSTKVTHLFDSFIADADISLLFLRNVSSITLLHISSNGVCNERLKVSVSKHFKTDLSHVKKESFDRKTCFKTVSHIPQHMKETKSQWLVTSCLLKQGYKPEIDSLASKLSFFPQVDAAFKLDGDRSLSNGRLSCFLPLPNNESNRTGLPIHINACFGLTDNRRFIKWQEEDQKNDESAKWNELLIKDILPHVYIMMILDAIQLSRNSNFPPATVYNLWPDLSKTVHKDRWHEVATDTLKVLSQYEIFHLASNEKMWVSPSDAVFPDNKICSDTMAAVSRLLISERKNLVTIPEHVLKVVLEIFPRSDRLTWVTPSYVRDVLQRSKAENLRKDDKYRLLEFALSDENYTELQGLKLLPLSDGTFTSFNNGVQNIVLMDNKKFPRTLLPFCRERFLADDLTQLCTMQLRKLATKRTYNIINLDAKHVVELTKKHLPEDWKVTPGQVSWKTKEVHHPPKSWLTEFWKFIKTECNELSSFIGMPLIPLEPLQSSGNTIFLGRLQCNTTLIFQSSMGSSLSDNIQKVLRMVGCTVIKRDPCLKHHDIESYVLPASPRNVLRVFVNSHRDQVIRGIASASSLEKEDLKMYLSSLDSLSNAERNLLTMLPVFRTMSGKDVTVQSKQAVVSNTNPVIPKDLPMPETFIQCGNEADRRLLTLLNIQLLDASQVAVRLVDLIQTASFHKGEEQKIMTWILNNGSILLSQSEQLLMKTRNLKFMETTHGERKQASSVFDPKNKTFQDLFEADLFPPSIYTKTREMLQSLQRLGLKTDQKAISTENILQVINRIETLCILSPNNALKKAHTLVQVLNENDFLSKFTRKQIEELIQRRWLPCANPKFLNGSTSTNLKSGLYRPAEVRHSMYSSIVGYVMPLVSELKGHVCNSLGLCEPPPAEKVLDNLSALRSVVKTNSDSQFQTKLHNIYKFMQDNMGDFRNLLGTKCIPWIWNKSEFVIPGDTLLVFPSGLDLSYYIKKVPEEFLQYEKLLTTFGVKKTLSEEDIEDILHDIKRRIDSRSPAQGNVSELKVSVAILDWMQKNEKLLKDSTPVPVMGQNQTFTLQPLSKTVFCDISNEGLDDLKEDNEEFYVIHEEVLPRTARWLKVPFLSTRILKPQFTQAEQESFDIEQCGQFEPITQRIKNILREYDEESDIFKELLQNAEDAGATTCKFLFDFRKHKDPPKTLLDDGMALCNGPCLWIYNNELFSQEDWKNILKVGSASKEKKVEMIGKFGLGFNAVYHISDIPSILSGKNLLILDPNVTHLEKHIDSRGNPGIKFDPFQERLYKRFPGQFKSYEGIFDCDLSVQNSKKAYDGTLIKLPFRTQEEANKSEICSKVYGKEHILRFRNHLADSSETHLLFLKNITSMSLQIVPENASTPLKNDQVESQLKISREIINSFVVSNDSLHQENRTREILHHNIIDVNKAHIVKIIQEHVKKPLTKYWLLFSCFGRQDSLKMFQRRNEQEQMFSFPIGGIAVPLHREAETKAWSPDESLSGQAFCFLPLSIETGLPVHINGTFAVTSNRKSLWEKGVKAEWNRALLKDPVTCAYITTLLELKKMSQNGHIQKYYFYTFWPKTLGVSKAFLPMVESFYSAVAQNANGQSLELFSNGHNWCSVDKVRFLGSKIEKNKAVVDIAMKLFLTLGGSYSCIVPLPSWVKQSFIDCGFESMVKDRTINWPEFYSIVFKNLSAVDSHNRNTLVLNAIDLNDPAVDDLLKNYPCIPTQSGKKLQLIRHVVNPSGKVACLYELGEGRFLAGTANDFLSPKRIQRLLDLGMISDCLHFEEIIERAEKISSVWQKDKSKFRKHLQCLMESMKESVDVNSPHWQTLSQIPFLPASAPYVEKKKNNRVLKKPADVYTNICHNLVSMTEFTVDHSNLQMHSYDPVLKKLRVQTTPPVQTVIQQLFKTQQHYSEFEKTTLFNIAHSCYDFLNNYLLEQNDPSPIISQVKTFPFIFIEDHFVNVKSVAISEGFEQRPYLYLLPVIFSKFERLWDCLGLKKQFTNEQFVAALEKIKASYGSRPLSQSDLHKSVAIIVHGLYKIEDEKLTNCLIPDETGVLTLSNKLRFNDSPWMPVSDGVKLSHELIPRPVACHFGVITTRHHTLKDHLVSGFSLDAKEFGQTEKLTVRLKNIIDAYPSKKDILKELIQNADDAQATEIHFVWDKRQHKTEKVFGEKWKVVQGPALCVYNNRTFSDADLQGIQQLGEGGKHGTLGRTGKYGLGFNSVYHLTDCPSILTGDKWLCVSDPNLKYLEGATKHSPGSMFSMGDSFKKSFEDVYHTFLPKMFVLNSGTMFRFPLRTEEMAEQSEISRHTITDRDMNELYYALVEDPEGLILFLKHITKIQFSEISKDGKQTKCSFLIEKKFTDKSMESKENFHRHVRESLMSGTAEPHKTIYSMEISSGKTVSQWAIAESFGFPTQIQETKDKHDYFKVPQAALAACWSSKFNETFTGRAFCSLPLPGITGLPVHVNANFEVDSSRRDLWKEDGESLKTEWNRSLKVNVISPLYADLLLRICSVIKKEKPTALVLLKLNLDSSCLKYFPCISQEVDKGWHEMIQEVYRSINQRDLPVIPTVHAVTAASSHIQEVKYTVTWSSVSKPHSVDCPYFTTDEHEEIFQILDDIGMKLVPNCWRMKAIKFNFKAAGVNVTEVSDKTVMNFLKEHSLNDPSQTFSSLPLPIDQTLIKHKKRCSKLLSFCLKNAKEKNVNDFNGLPLLLTEDQMLQVFDSQCPKLISRFRSLFQGHQEMFADIDVNGKHTKILQTGNYIKSLTIEMAAPYLKSELAQLLTQSLPDQKCKLYEAQPDTIKWLKHLWHFFEDQEKFYQNEKLNVFNEIKKHFDDSPILPVICPNQNNTCFLQTMRNISKVIQNPNEKTASILIKLGFMTLDFSFFSHLTDIRFKYIYPELLQTVDSGAVLEELHRVPHCHFEKLSEEECEYLQRFLQTGIRDSKKQSEHAQMLKSLPLFESISGKRERIDLHRSVFILNSKHQTDFPNLYNVEGHDSIFLKYSSSNLQMSEIKVLNIKILDDLEFCVQFILPSVHTMKETNLLDLMRLLVKLGPVDQRIVSALRGVRFIRDINGCLQMASYFYDDSVPLYQVMLPKERFVPKTFWDIFQDKLSEGHCLLKKLGLKHEVTDEEIIRFAQQIESECRGDTPLDVLKKKSKLLFTNALSKSNENNSKLLNKVAGIKFIFPVKIQQNLCDYHKPFAQEREVVAISGSLIDRDSNHHYLIWTSMPILPSEYCSSRHIKKIIEAGALETPPPGQIAANLRNICRSPCQTDELLKTRKAVFTRSYAHLQSIDFSASQFSDFPIILVEKGTTLVKPEQTALVLKDDLEFRPYFYKIPPEFMIFVDFFKKIGVKERPTVSQYVTVLQEIYSESYQKDSLQANQQKTVKRVVQQLFVLLEEDQNKNLFQNDPLYLPSTDGRLYESSNLFFNDTVFQATRLEGPLESKLKLLEKLACCHLGNDTYEHQKILLLLPEQVRPKFLSNVISENLEEASVQYCNEGECEFSGWFDQHLSSAAFLHGLICLIREESKGGVSQSEAAAKCEEIFSKIQIICCKTLHTELLLNLEPLEGSRDETDVYVKQEQDGCSFYLKHSDDMALKVINEVNMCLTKEINCLLKNCLSTESLPTLGQLLLCDNMDDVEKTLAKNGVRNSNQKEEGHGALPKPGCRIPEEWHDCLDMNFLNNYESGEYVGFSKDESGEYFYAIVIKQVEDPVGQTAHFPAKYEIQVGSDKFIEVSSLDLYQFKREKKATTSTGFTCTDLVPLLTSRPQPQTQTFPETLEEIKKEIDKSLSAIWKMSGEDKQKALRRLYLQWHPDKNPDHEELANEAFKYLKNRIEELKQGKTAHGSNTSSNFNTSSNWWNFENFYDTWNREARSHRRGRERFYQNYSRRHYNFWSYHNDTPRPNRGEAKRWFEQAQCDLRAADKDTGGDSSEWCLFKVHQAVEKALIAAMYRKNGRYPNNCSITGLALQVSQYCSQLASLPKTVKHLTELGVDGKKTQYPNLHQFPHIPNKQFYLNNARKALDIATNLLETIQAYIS